MKLIFPFLIYLLPIAALSQNEMKPGNKSVNSEILKTGRFTWGWYEDARGNLGNELGNEIVKIERNTKNIIFVKNRISKKLGVNETDSLVLDAKTLEPVYTSYKGEEVSYFIQYGATVKGVRTIFETKKKENLNEPLDGKYYDKQSLPLLISCLPLSVGYEATFPVIDYSSDFKPLYYKYKITDVSEMESVSDRSGKHAVWVVKVLDKFRSEYLFYIDKQTRRILRTDLISYAFFDKELDVNPIKAPFNADETMAMITQGSASIKGQAYSRGYGKKMDDSRDKKKQYAEKGSVVLLIPNTAYFKEWVDYNLKLSKLTGPVYTVDWGGMFGGTGENNKTTIGTGYPLPREVEKCVLTTKVIDDKGNFVFQNLKQGEYLVFVNFTVDEYSHTTKEYVGQSVTVYGDGNISSYPVWDIKDWTTPGGITAHKYVTVKKDGEMVDLIFNK